MIHPYPSDLGIMLPETFTDPFRYRPHPHVTLAADLLMDRIKGSAELSEIFAEGKMIALLEVIMKIDKAPTILAPQMDS